ncbi:MAG TPA: TonB family protein [Gemmatimonadaceae bacterium]|nr:TonB family protein [Gemmatimonadaceae bacterium]
MSQLMHASSSSFLRLARAAILLSIAASLCICARASAQVVGNVSGVVTDSAGAPLLGAEVTIDGSQARAFTEADGSFHLGAVPLGTRTINARRLGFSPNRVTVEVAQGADAAVVVRLTALPIALPTVLVKPTGMKYTGRLAGYYERLEKRSSGYFITRDQIDQEGSRLLGQLLQHVPGVTAVRLRGGLTGIRLRGRTCSPLVWIDGTPMPSGEVDLDSFSPTSIHGIELYLGSTTAPARYIYTRDVSSCGTILIWSRGPDTDPIVAAPQPSVDVQSLLSENSVFRADQVDRKAALDTARSTPPAFPPSLYAAGIPGLVIAEFVVDTTGHVENGTLGIVSSTAPLFTEAVRVALEETTFVPAIRNGRSVRQFVQQPFEFSVKGHNSPR